MGKLDGSIAKFNRAGEQISALNRAIATTVQGYSYTPFVAERDNDPAYWVIRVRAKQDGLPIKVSVVIGEIAHDLRSSLDLLAYQLALPAVNSNPALAEHITFPIFLYGPRSNRKRQRWSDSRPCTGQPFKRGHRAFIKGSQPYHRRNGQRLSPLWLLHQLNNADKHRLIQVTALSLAGAREQTITLTRDPANVHHAPFLNSYELYPGVTLKDGAKVGRIGTDSGEYVQVDFKVTAKVVFAEGCDAVKGLELMPVLVSAHNSVGEILHHFLTDPQLN